MKKNIDDDDDDDDGDDGVAIGVWGSGFRVWGL